MARGTQFGALVIQLRGELRRSSNVAVGVDDVPSLKTTLNHQYATLYMQRDWSHLRKVFSITLSAGQRFYGFPTGLNVERVEKAAIYLNALPFGVSYGIDFESYATFNSFADERSEPVQQWDVRWESNASMIEVWPIPSRNTQVMRIQGIQAITPLVNDIDLCLLDDNLVVLFAAAELAAAKKADDADLKLKIAQEHLRMLTARMRTGAGSGQRMGLGSDETSRGARVVVKVA